MATYETYTSVLVVLSVALLLDLGRARQEAAGLEAAAAPAAKPPAQAVTRSPAARSSAGTEPAPEGAPALVGVVAEPPDWIRALGEDATRDDAVSRLRALLLRASRHELERRRQGLVSGDAELDQVMREATAAALTSVLARLDEYRGEARFTTWASKFALHETAVRLRKLDWERRQAVRPASIRRDRSMPPALRSTLEQAVTGALTPRERHVFERLIFDGMPIDVLADELRTTRGDVYETLRGARRTLRGRLDSASVRT